MPPWPADVSYSHFIGEKVLSTEQIEQMVQWLNQQIMNSCESINEAHQTNNYGKESQFEGMRDGFIRCLKKLDSI